MGPDGNPLQKESNRLFTAQRFATTRCAHLMSCTGLDKRWCGGTSTPPPPLL